MGFLAHGFDQVIPAFHGSYLFIAAAIVAGFLHYKFQKEDLSLLGAVLVMTTPICLRLAGEPMVDLVLAVYFGAGFSAGLFFREISTVEEEI